MGAASEEVEVDPATGVPIEDLMVSAATVGTLFDPASEETDELIDEVEGGVSDLTQPGDVAKSDPDRRNQPIMMGFHQVDFNDDEAISEMTAGIGEAIMKMVEESGIPLAPEGEGGVASVGGVAIPKGHRGSFAEANAWIEDQTRKGLL